EKVERFRFALAALLAVFGRERSEFQQARLFGMQLQLELAETLSQLLPKPRGVRLMLESEHDVVGEPHNDDIAAGLLLPPCLDPEVEYVVEVDVRQQWRRTSALWRTFLHTHSLPILQHACVQPLLDEPHDALVGNPVLDEFDQP